MKRERERREEESRELGDERRGGKYRAEEGHGAKNAQTHCLPLRLHLSLCSLMKKRRVLFCGVTTRNWSTHIATTPPTHPPTHSLSTRPLCLSLCFLESDCKNKQNWMPIVQRWWTRVGTPHDTESYRWLETRKTSKPLLLV